MVNKLKFTLKSTIFNLDFKNIKNLLLKTFINKQFIGKIIQF
jgi:hypothetical protein